MEKMDGNGTKPKAGGADSTVVAVNRIAAVGEETIAVPADATTDEGAIQVPADATAAEPKPEEKGKGDAKAPQQPQGDRQRHGNKRQQGNRRPEGPKPAPTPQTRKDEGQRNGQPRQDDRRPERPQGNQGRQNDRHPDRRPETPLEYLRRTMGNIKTKLEDMEGQEDIAFAVETVKGVVAKAKEEFTAGKDIPSINDSLKDAFNLLLAASDFSRAIREVSKVGLTVGVEFAKASIAKAKKDIEDGKKPLAEIIAVLVRERDSMREAARLAERKAMADEIFG